MAYIGSEGIKDRSHKYKHLNFFEKDGDNCNFSWNEQLERWSGNIYMPEVSAGLYETTNLFIIEQFGQQEYYHNGGITGEFFEGGVGIPLGPVQFETDEVGRKDSAVKNGTFIDFDGVLPNEKPMHWNLPGAQSFQNRFIQVDGGGLILTTDGAREVSISQDILKKDTPYSWYIKVSELNEGLLFIKKITEKLSR